VTQEVKEEPTQWAVLNTKGKRGWGEVFSDGFVPIMDLAPIKAQLSLSSARETVYRVDLQAIDASTLEVLYLKIAEKAGAGYGCLVSTRGEVEKALAEEGLALRVSLVEYTVKAIEKVGAIL